MILLPVNNSGYVNNISYNRLVANEQPHAQNKRRFEKGIGKTKKR